MTGDGELQHWPLEKLSRALGVGELTTSPGTEGVEHQGLLGGPGGRHGRKGSANVGGVHVLGSLAGWVQRTPIPPVALQQPVSKANEGTP